VLVDKKSFRLLNGIEVPDTESTNVFEPIYNPPVAASFHFEHSIPFSPESATEILRAIPALPGVFALHGPPAPTTAEPYLTRAADLRRRITRILAPPEPSAKGGQPSADGRPAQSKRLNLRTRVARIDFTITGSEFESTLTLYHASAAVFGLAEARRRLRLHTPFFLRFTAGNAFPRVYSTNRLSRRALAHTYGPFPSRAAADRYCDAVLDLFKLRRCYEDLAPYPEHPGCVYQEMNKCLAPCNQACTPQGAAAYSAEAAAVEAFFATHGESLLTQLTTEREQASANLDFERAAQLHAQFLRVKSAATLADSLVQPIPQLRAVIVQKSAQPASSLSAQSASLLSFRSEPFLSSRSAAEGSASPVTGSEAEPSAAVFLVASGCITGPARLSTLGVRAVKDQASVGSSLFAQPLMLQAVLLEEPPTQNAVILSGDATPSVASQSKDPDAVGITDSARSVLPPTPAAASSATLNPEDRAAHLLADLATRAKPHPKSAPDLATLSDHLSLLRRWYYRPEKQRTGEAFLPKDDSTWPIRRILNAAARISLGDPKPTPEAHRDPPPTPVEPVH
jgi:excinuclease ABC subunit C